MQGDSQSIRDGLRDVIDFEIGLDVVALGMIREIDIAEEQCANYDDPDLADVPYGVFYDESSSRACLRTD